MPPLKRTLFHRIARWFGIGFLASCAVCFLVAIGYSVYKVAFIYSAVKTQGQIVNLNTRIDSDGDELYAPIFQFKANDGQIYTITSTLATKPASFQPGDPVEVLYRASNPKGAEIKSPGQQFFLPFVCSIVGFVHGIIGACAFYYAKRRDKRLINR